VAMLHTSAQSLLAETLLFSVKLPVCMAVSGQLLQPGQVYTAPAARHLIVNPDARLTVSDAPRRRLFRPSADWLFESAAASFGSRQIAVVLSGFLFDGAAGVRAVKRAGGLVLVQAPEEAVHADMPRAAIATGCVDRILPIRAIAQAVSDVLHTRDVSLDLAAWEAPFDDPGRRLSA
jgi:two-component system, chemotaxis family, protein-glutamate methylesterase/glutaminase